MRLPSIGQYIDALLNPEAFVCSLGEFILPLRSDGEPIYYSGNFGVVFKVYRGGTFSSPVDKRSVFAIKCFTRQQWGRREAYRRIIDRMPKSDYLVSMRYLEDELLVAPYGSDVMQSCDVLVMDYIEGDVLCEAISSAVRNRDRVALMQLCSEFVDMSLWLLSQEFAHGDIKPANIMVSHNCKLTLIDYDGVFTADMNGEAQRELGTPPFQHPLRADLPFSKAIDDYSLAIITLSLFAIAIEPELYDRFNEDRENLIIDPSEAVRGESVALNYIDRCTDTPKNLIELVKSPLATLPELRFVLLELKNRIESVLSTFNLANCSTTPLPFEDNAKWGYKLISGEVVVEPSFDMAWEYCDEGLALVKVGRKYGFIDQRGEFVVDVVLEYASSFCEGFAIAALNGKYGFINLYGNWVVKPQYDFARNFRDGIAQVEMEGRVIKISADNL